MPHDTSLIGTIVAGLGVAFLMGALAHRLKISPIAGYLLAGVMVGPFTPGFVADTGLALQLAEIGVILLMFGVGLHFSLKDLLSVRKIAVPGAIAQIAVATALGMMLGLWLGWSVEGSIVFGLALSVASTYDDASRFCRFSSAGSYLGLTPRRYESGEVSRNGRISKRGDKLT